MLAYAFSLKETINKVMLPVMDDLIRALCKMAKDNADVPMLCRTDNEVRGLFDNFHLFLVILGDFTGSSGNHNANLVAYPEVDWQQIAKEFVEETLGLSFNPYMRVMERYGLDVWRYKIDGEVTEGSFKEFVSDLEIPEDAKANLLKLRPLNYIGQAANIVDYIDQIVHDLENTVSVM
ncbi:hypothetical protein MKW92_020088 [Papaver armeniacum]|nr:hypothetical protein MKW92_020088 [Papaver armeniacum]